MSTGVLTGQILLVASIAALGVTIATDWTATAPGHRPQLGAPWFLAFGMPVYPPWCQFQWWHFDDAYAPDVFTREDAIAASRGVASTGAAIASSVWRARRARQVTTYGSARRATDDEIAASGLLNSAGVFLGRHDGHYLRHDDPEHVMAFAQTRSGKGVGLVVPTLLTWPGSAVIHDIKGENWQLTAGWRSRFSHCLLFNPTDARSAAMTRC